MSEVGKKPIVLSTSSEEAAAPYLEALKAVGFSAEEIEVVGPEQRSFGASLAAGARGLVLAGGADLEPWRYGEEVREDAGVLTVPDRDELEWALLDGARSERIPVWAICRGLQVANVYFGGSLWQDLPSQRPRDVKHAVDLPKDALSHSIAVPTLESPFAECLGRRFSHDPTTPLAVNSRHHQAIKSLGEGLRAVAHSPDDLIEAIELDPLEEGSTWWLRGVQWHPENLIVIPEQLALWRDFAEAVRGPRGRREEL